MTMEPKDFPAVTMGYGIRWAVEQKVHEGWGPVLYVGDWGTLGRSLNLSVAVPTGLEGRMDDFLDRWWAGGCGALWSLHGSLVPGYQYPMGQEGEREGRQAAVYFRDHSCLEQAMPASHPARQVHQTQTVAQPRHLLGKHPAGLSSKEVRQCPMAQDWFSVAPPPLNILGAHFLPAARTRTPISTTALGGSGRVTCRLASPERRWWGRWREESKARRKAGLLQGHAAGDWASLLIISP